MGDPSDDIILGYDPFSLTLFGDCIIKKPSTVHR